MGSIFPAQSVEIESFMLGLLSIGVQIDHKLVDLPADKEGLQDVEPVQVLHCNKRSVWKSTALGEIVKREWGYAAQLYSKQLLTTLPRLWCERVWALEVIGEVEAIRLIKLSKDFLKQAEGQSWILLGERRSLTSNAAIHWTLMDSIPEGGEAELMALSQEFFPVLFDKRERLRYTFK